MNFRNLLTSGLTKPQARRSSRMTQSLAAERLEVRNLMTGNVTTMFRNGTLTISGDAQDNQVEVTQPALGTIRVAGLDGTTINGNDSAVIANVRHVTFRLTQGGTDDVAIQGPITVAGNLRATFGNGNFNIEGSGGLIEIGRDLFVVGGQEGNVALLNEVLVRGSTNIQTGGDMTAAAGLSVLPDFDAATFSDSLTIDNPYFPLVVGTVYTYEAEGIDDQTDEPFTETIIVEVLPETKTILGVETRVVRDRVYKDGLLIEDTLDWHAQDDNGNVWYLGEDVTNFDYDENGNLIGTDKHGSWEAGVDGGQAGTIIQANPQVGDTYYQEFQPGNVLDQGEVLSRNETFTFPAGTFTDVLRTKDTTQREPFGLDNKLYAPGVGLIGEFKFDLEDNEVNQTVRLVSMELDGVPVTELVSPDGFTGTNPTGKTIGGVTLTKSVRIRTEGVILLKGVDLRGDARLTSAAETFVIDSEFHRASSITAGEAVTFRNVTGNSTTSIRGDIDVHVFDSNLRDLTITLGSSNNLLAIQDSIFSRLFANGDRGDDIFDTVGRNKFASLRLNSF